jgi:hypothetical protein
MVEAVTLLLAKDGGEGDSWWWREEKPCGGERNPDTAARFREAATRTNLGGGGGCALDLE